MKKDEIFQAISKNPVFFLGTIDDDKPRVRGMLLYKADENGIIFHTGGSKDLYKQILKNPAAELCSNCNGTQIRISGKLDIINDDNLKEEIYNHPSRKFMEQWRSDDSLSDSDKELIILSLKHGTIVTWTMEDNFAAKSPIIF
ncbi:hypothetical protein CBU02nite_16210 [Clostridium butyricum]|uniref:Pyridoxamine 5'-phosphate oxidase N-terminal domain-containing protein n=1 Tax=Clostridium butyricum TaxID=1492 RepID=A0A512TLM3_CLOBU|nr:pyridoxamine 5'-phosphate oxidase family protein [Clostridium butyricum]NOW23919.1 putative pyridoxamine 5'-phosphate oxidase family protein [Clostridium butyricum]GEQ21115.1 hypothetical protein CBU02nite_16210 [Clostridium butyricum]